MCCHVCAAGPRGPDGVDPSLLVGPTGMCNCCCSGKALALRVRVALCDSPASCTIAVHVLLHLAGLGLSNLNAQLYTAITSVWHM